MGKKGGTGHGGFAALSTPGSSIQVKKALAKHDAPKREVLGKSQATRKDAASFLKHRMGQKVKNLQAPTAYSGEDNDKDDAMEDSEQAPAAIGSVDALFEEASRKGEEFAEWQEPEIPEGGDLDQEWDEAAVGNANREADNTRKKFYSELRKVLAAADVIIEVLDARDPQSCRSEVLEKEVTSSGKRLVLLINKIDLAPKEAVEAWVKHLKRSHPAIAFKAAHGGAHRPTHAMTSVSNASEGLLRSTHAVVGADELMQLLKNYSRQGGKQLKTHLTVGVVGYPNTGKSSVINSMKRSCSVETGGRAGVTKLMQEVQLDSKVTLIDSPGIVFEGASDDPSVVLRNVLRVEKLKDPIRVVEALTAKAPREALLQFYGMQRDFQNVKEFLIHVAQVRGKTKRNTGGVPAGLDLETAAKTVISDWTTGKFRYYVLPPSSSAADAAAAEAESAQVVNTMAPALDIDAMFNNEVGEEPSILGAPQEDEIDPDDEMEGDVGVASGPVEVDLAGIRRKREF